MMDDVVAPVRIKQLREWMLLTERPALIEMDELLALAEALREWGPNIGDRVRIKSMPEEVYVVEKVGIVVTIRLADYENCPPRERYRAELMPEGVG